MKLAHHRLVALYDGGRPFTGAWIETRQDVGGMLNALRSPLHGGVD